MEKHSNKNSSKNTSSDKTKSDKTKNNNESIKTYKKNVNIKNYRDLLLTDIKVLIKHKKPYSVRKIKYDNVYYHDNKNKKYKFKIYNENYLEFNNFIKENGLKVNNIISSKEEDFETDEEDIKIAKEKVNSDINIALEQIKSFGLKKLLNFELLKKLYDEEELKDFLNSRPNF